jgi:hypothetical protein
MEVNMNRRLIIVLNIFAIALYVSCINKSPSNSAPNPIFISAKAIDTLIASDSIWLKTDPIVWRYDTSGFSNVSIIVRGKSNTPGIGIETYGDGDYYLRKMSLDSLGQFDDTLEIEFVPAGGVYLKENTKIHLIKSIGDTIKIDLRNPLQN